MAMWYDSTINSIVSFREDINGKKTFSFGHCPNHLTPPPLTPIRATWSFFSDVKIQKICKKVGWEGGAGKYIIINNL